MARPRVNEDGVKELRKIDEQIGDFRTNLNNLTQDEMNKAPLQEEEPQVKMSTREQKKADAPYIKPIRSINSRELPNPKFEKMRKYAWEYVRCIVENKEIRGEKIETWTKRFAGDSADFWHVPVNKPIYIPRLLADQLRSCIYHRLVMEADSKTITGADAAGTYIGAMVAESTLERVSCQETASSSFMSLAY